MSKTLNKSRYFTRSVRVTILSLTRGGQIAFGSSTAPVRIVGIFAPTVTKVTLKIAAKAMLDMDGGGMASLKGGLVKIN